MFVHDFVVHYWRIKSSDCVSIALYKHGDIWRNKKCKKKRCSITALIHELTQLCLSIKCGLKVTSFLYGHKFCIFQDFYTNVLTKCSNYCVKTLKMHLISFFFSDHNPKRKLYLTKYWKTKTHHEKYSWIAIIWLSHSRIYSPTQKLE